MSMSSAVLSPCGKYRYLLTRRIPQAIRWVKPCLFIMLNPSTADALRDDPTIKRCIYFANRELCTSLTVVNLFSFRATKPTELRTAVDPFGPDNRKHLIEQLSAHIGTGLIIAAWGSDPMVAKAAEHLDLISQHMASCLTINKDGNPKHPLYVKGDAVLRMWTRGE
jgi:hypothetical protein